MSSEIEFGLNSFGEVAVANSGRVLSDAETVRTMVDEAILAESVGIDSFSIGEHYRPNHVDSAGHVILAAIASRTSTLRLGTSVTVLSTHDPVRLYTEFATLHAVSNGRAQMILGRASSAESYPLFGFNLADYEQLFEEKLDLFTQLLQRQPVTWSGTVRSSLTEQSLSPALEQPLPTWVGVGGSPQSVLRAARYGLPLMLAIIGGEPSRFRPMVDLYHRALTQLGQPDLPIGEHSLGHIAETDEEAHEGYWPLWNDTLQLVSRERGFPAPTRYQFDRDVSEGALFVGSPDSVAGRIADAIQTLGLSRFDFKYDIGRMTTGQRFRSIELFGREVVPRVRGILASARTDVTVGGTR